MSRSYRFLCPISRALDRVGDRWTLLILRDLHAGPMRFGDLLSGLPGLASNLLTTRLQKLQIDGLIDREDGLYALTPVGRQTDELLWSLARLGATFPPDDDLKTPGNMRLVAITLQNGLQRVAPPPRPLSVKLVIDGEPFTLSAGPDQQPTVRAGAPIEPDVTAKTAYTPLMATAGGEMPLSSFRAQHVQLEGDEEALPLFAELMARVMLEAFNAVAD